MRHKQALLFTVCALAFVLTGGAAQAQAFLDTDWLLHRGTPQRVGSNNSDQPPQPRKARVWVWPPTADMQAEAVVDNTTLPAPIFPVDAGNNLTTWDNSVPAGPPYDQRFGVQGNWFYPATASRGPGAWPPSAADTQIDKLGDYVYTNARHSTVLASVGLSVLSKLPNLGADLEDPVPGGTKNVYRIIHEELLTDTTYARWTFGTRYPANTFQGRRNVGGAGLAPNQRYAIYIRFPSSSTTDTNNVIRPNADHVMVRVSWGNDVNDPITSRIFMLNFGETGGFWKRIRTGPGDDRYFPYDGVHPLTVTLYSLTPDAQPNELGVNTVIVADAVRLVPESLRGDIHAPAASALFPPGGGPGSIQLTYFGRDETAGPQRLFPTLADPGSTAGFLPIPFNPTLPPQADPSLPNYNPYIAEPSSSIRSAVFYCFEDDIAGGQFYGRLRWRYVARTTPVPTTTIDDTAGPPNFTTSGGFVTIVPGDQSYGGTYRIESATPLANPAATATWEAVPPAGASPTETYSVFVWIPAGNDGSAPYARRAHYTINTNAGVIDVFLDQRNTNADPTMPGQPRLGTWRRLASGIRFPSGVFNGNPTATLLNLTLSSGSDSDAAAGRVVVADAVQFVPESQTSNSVVAAPLIANVTWPSGTVRQVVYFATTDGHLWALDALGTANSSLTTAYWVYPSISNPQDPNGNGVFDGPQEDPNYALNDKQGIDGDLRLTQVGNPPRNVYTVVNKVPDLGAFHSSPVYVEVQQANARVPYIVIGNQNGRIYAFNPTGRTNANGEPFAATFAAGDNPGVPGTTERLMTWPTTAREKWLIDSTGRPFSSFTDDPAKGVFSASPTVPVDAQGVTDRVIVGAGDGHVYAVDLQVIQNRISNANNPAGVGGAPRWQYPDTTAQLDPILLPGALTSTNRFIFTAGGRVYAIDNPNTQANGLATLQWVYPFTSAPPGNPNPGDKPRFETLFTAPAWKNGLTLNNGAGVVFIANRDGRVFALDDGNTTNGQEPAVLWESRTFGSTRAGAVFVNEMVPQQNFRDPGGGAATPGPAVLLPIDTGAIIALKATTGRLFWGFLDANLGGVPLPAANSDPNDPTTFVPFFTSSAGRPGDGITANNWVYNGDEGNQDTGETNGQMRAYALETIGLITPDEPDVRPADNNQVDIRLVELFNGASDTPPGPWDRFGDPNPMNALSPYDRWKAAETKPNTRGSVVVYEWGDSIRVAAWGAYTGSVLPTVTFRLYSGATSRPPVTVGAQPDRGYNPAAHGALTIDGQPAQPWVAKYTFPLGRGSEADPQTPGTRYTIFAQAQVSATGGATFPTVQLAAGQATVTQTDPNPLPTQDVNDATQARQMVVAHPLALTTSGLSQPTLVGTGSFNIIGWTTNIPADNSTTDFSEIVANGNRIADPNTIVAIGAKDTVAPVGPISHGSSAAYMGVDANGNRVPALFIADRSNLYKLNQPLNNVRVERRELRWGWNPNDANQRATGNVMNPLPWETFPNTVPNVSPDYPDIDRTRATFRGGGIDLATRGIALPRPEIVGTTKNLQPLALDLQLDVPLFQPANVNRDYFDINGTRNPGLANGLTAPMAVNTGRGVTGGPLIAPSAGYVGSFVIYLDSNGDGRYQGSSVDAENQQAAGIGREEVFRQLNVGVAVPPDISIRTEEETVDIGKVPHSLGFTPNIPFAPSGLGPYNGGAPMNSLVSPWDVPGQTTFFQPFTVKNHGNVNLVNVRVAKVVGDENTNPADPQYWVRLVSDQVEPLSNLPIFGVPFNFLAAQGAAGNLGIVTTLDHSNSATNFEIDYFARYGAANFWPEQNPYVLAGNAVGWNAGEQPRPTLHKARVGDSTPTVLSIPDVAYGDPAGLLTSLAATREVKPKIGVAIPLGTPAGTYSAPIYTFEDNTPPQWREWVNLYRTLSGTTGDNAMDVARDDDGVLNIQIAGGQTTPVEGVANPTFNLKVTVREARLTNEPSFPNGVSPAGSFRQIDARSLDGPAFGTDLQPVGWRDRGTGNLLLYWASNRQNNFQPALQTPDTPWYLFFSRLNPVIGNVPPYGAIYDWRFETNGTRWWEPLANQAQYPGSAVTTSIFPRQQSDVVGNPNTPVVPGEINPLTERHATPALAQDDDPDKPAPPVWLFWQAFVYKNAGMGGQSSVLDTRTVYVPLTSAGVPDTSVNNGLPFSFLNDPALPKYAPKPIIFTDLNGNVLTYLFWYGGPRGRTKLYYNANLTDLTDLTAWTRDTALDTPGTLQMVSDPVPIHRFVVNQNGQLVDAIDLIYTGVLSHRKQAEIILTRYGIGAAGRLFVMRLPRVDDELLVRDGVSQTWYSRDLAWVFRQGGSFVDANGDPFFIIRVNGNRVNLGPPTYDRATGRLYFASALGGQLYVDPQSGGVTFPTVAPRQSDRVTATYIPQSMRINVTRNESGAIQPPAGWANDAGFALRPHVPAPGSNVRPVAFIDRSPNDSRSENIIGLPAGGGSMFVTRLWTFYRKSNTNVAAPASIYYKTMRLMVRLPRGVLRSAVNGVLSPVPHVRVVGNRGPVEIDWVRGRLYFTEADEGNVVTVDFDYARDANGVQTVPPTQYRVAWGDEISAAVQPGDQSVHEAILPTDTAVNEGQVFAFKDPFQDKVWVFWSSTRAGTTDLYYMAISPQFYSQPAQ